jgi:hypothetical protein
MPRWPAHGSCCSGCGHAFPGRFLTPPVATTDATVGPGRDEPNGSPWAKLSVANPAPAVVAARRALVVKPVFT